jgi:hypothetical protein
MSKEKAIKFEDLVEGKEVYGKYGNLTALLSKDPPETWIKTHPYIKGYRYLPIDKIEYLLRQIFREYEIEILREGESFNGVHVVVRVHYRDIVGGDMKFHDGIGATELQTIKGGVVSNFQDIKTGAISMAYPVAKTVAIKDACDHFGRLFGSDLNRKDLVEIKQPVTTTKNIEQIQNEKEYTRKVKAIKNSETIHVLLKMKSHIGDDEKLNNLYNEKLKTFKQ